MEVYCITNTINSKEYVGVTTRSIEERFKEHCKAESYIGRAIRKHGIENFSVRCIDTADTVTELWEKEVYWIKRKKAFGNGYNLTMGGGGLITYDPTVEIKLTKNQKQFVDWVDRENRKPIDIDNPSQMVRSIMINTMRCFLMADLIKDKRKSAEMIARLKPIYLKEVMKAKVFDYNDLKEWIA